MDSLEVDVDHSINMVYKVGGEASTKFRVLKVNNVTDEEIDEDGHVIEEEENNSNEEEVLEEKDSKAPNTGDRIVLYLSLFNLSIIGVIVVTRLYIKREKLG